MEIMICGDFCPRGTLLDDLIKKSKADLLFGELGMLIKGSDLAHCMIKVSGGWKRYGRETAILLKII